MVLQLLKKKFQQEVNEHYQEALSEAKFIARLVEKELHYAEQLAITLSHEADIISHLSSTNQIADQLRNLNDDKRKALLETLGTTHKVNSLFARLFNDVDLMSVFLLDSEANCVATSYNEVGESREKKGCLGSNYQTRHYFKLARLSGHGRQFAVGRNVPIPSLFFSHASTVDEQFMGAVVVRLNAEKLISGLKVLDSDTWIIDRLGVVINSTHEPSIYRHVGSDYSSKPTPSEIENIYAQTSMDNLSLTHSRLHFSIPYLFEFDGKEVVLARVNVEGQDFEVWHSLDIQQALHLTEQNRYLTLAIIVLGLLTIVIVERASDHHQRNIAQLDQLAKANLSLAKASNELYSIAITDHLTQISSRGYFLQRLNQEVERAHIENNSFCILQLDIDFFKRINDTYGHTAGDQAICHMAQLCRHAVRDSDLLGRMGGEEFSVGLIECDTNKALKIAESIRLSCEKSALQFEGEKISFTCSIGVARLQHGQSAEQLLSVADKALYQAKRSGRNNVQLYRS